MSPRLKLSSCIVEKLANLEEEANYGYLLGHIYNSTLFIINFILELDEEDGKPAYADMQLNFPTDVEFCGIVKFNNNLSESRIKHILQNVDVTDNPLILTSSKDKLEAQFLIHDRFEDAEYETVELNDLWEQFVHLRLKTTLPLFCEVTTAGVKESIQSKRKKIAAGQVSFHFSNTDVYLAGDESEAGLSGINGEPTVDDLLNHSYAHLISNKKGNTPEIKVIEVNLLLKTTGDSMSDDLVKTAVKMMSTQGKPAYCIKLPLNIDVLSIAHVSSKLVPLYNVLLESACRALRLLEKNILEQLGQEGIGDGGGVKIPDVFHFLPNACGYFVSQIIPRQTTNDMTIKQREYLHTQLCIPKSYPQFRRENAFIFDKYNYEGLLVNPHEAINAKFGARAGSKVALVRGYYTYHHYMQDKFDDSGWGCAYRSLQTVFSWFRFQGFTDCPIPTHRQIQLCLVKLGDKMSSFIGSKQWIGSTEVSYCLESLIGVQSKIIFANSGSDLQTYSQELLYHFQKYGSPIMIGGGVLAHTILGVEYSSDTGELRYLILDPHYTGGEDINTVVNKGWCAWKTNDFWDKTAHYNLCLPLTEECI